MACTFLKFIVIVKNTLGDIITAAKHYLNVVKDHEMGNLLENTEGSER